jgi:TRAP-type C4-dicarboxylate transport system permease small subunit
MDSVKNVQNKILVIFHKIEDWLLILTIASIVILSTLQIFLRNIFESGIAWISPLLGVLLLWVGLLGAVIATRHSAHIKINIVSEYLPGILNKISQLIVDLFSAGILFVLSYYSIEFVRLDYDSSTLAFGAMPVWVTETILPVSFALMGVRFLALGVVDVTQLVRGRAE